MGIFDSFGSFITDQKSRITNVINTEATVLQNIASTLTFGAIAPGGNISATTNNKTINTVLQAGANNPLTTAGLVAVPASGAARSAIATTVGGLSNTAKVGLATASYVGVNIAASNPGGTVNAVLTTPSSLANFGSNIGAFTANPSITSAEKIITDNPFISGAVGAGVVALGANTVSHLLDSGSRTINSLEIASNTNALQDAVKNGIPINVPVAAAPVSAPVLNSAPVGAVSNQQQPIMPVAKKKKKKSSPKKKKKPKKKQKKKSIKKKKSKKKRK